MKEAANIQHIFNTFSFLSLIGYEQLNIHDIALYDTVLLHLSLGKLNNSVFKSLPMIITSWLLSTTVEE